MENAITQKVNLVWKNVFSFPKLTYSYDELIFVKQVLWWNTYRGFHKIDKNKPWAKAAFEKVMRLEKINIIQSLKDIKSEKDMDTLSKYLHVLIKKELEENTKWSQLHSFNKIRKPIDIILEHIVALSIELDEVRSHVVKFLFLPLDSQMFNSDFVFSNDEIKYLWIKRDFSFKDIQTEDHYFTIQNFLREKAQKIHIDARIYFDLIWWDRYKKDLKNLFADSDLT